MSRAGPVIPVYPTFAQFVRLFGRRAEWREWFPFNTGAGNWTFSGRVALYHGLPSLRLPAQSTILVPSYHQGVEIDAVLAGGYRLRYYRVDEHLSIDLADVERRLDNTVSALYVIHYFGFAQPLEPIRRFCEAHRLRLIEDCALSLFSQENGTWLGSVGDLALFSVYKTLPLPHGGFMVTKARQTTRALAPAPRSSTFAQGMDLLHQGLEASGWWRLEEWWTHASRRVAKMIEWDRNGMVGSGGALWDPRLLEYGASPWIPRLMGLMDRDAVVARRRANYTRLASRLRGHATVPFPELPAGTCPLFFPVMVPDKIRFQQELDRLGVGSVNLWDASHPSCPPELAEEVAGWRRHCLELPIHQELSADQMDRVADAVLRVLGSAAAPRRGITGDGRGVTPSVRPRSEEFGLRASAACASPGAGEPAADRQT
jgi:dTDP-4-amino-4,6-dideoxygalactose transaminase